MPESGVTAPPARGISHYGPPSLRFREEFAIDSVSPRVTLMTTMTRLPCVTLRVAVATATAALTASCLPDPRPYDACRNEGSEYYAVAPKGCNGHNLVTLAISESRTSEGDPNDFASSGVPFYFSVHPKLVLDKKYVYWAGPDGAILRTSKTGESTAVLRAATSVSPLGGPETGSSTIVADLSGSGAILYIAVLHVDAQSGRYSSQVIAIDLASQESRVVADLVDISPSKLEIADNRFLLLTSSGAGILSGPLDQTEVVNTSELRALVVGQIYDFVVVENRAYFVSYDSRSLQSLNLVDGSMKTLLPVSAYASKASVLVATAGQVYFFDCGETQQYSCSWSRVSSDGDSEVAVAGLSNQDGTIVADAASTYFVGSLASMMYSPMKLYGWSGPVANPTTMAAPFENVRGMALDSTYVYVAEALGDSLEGEGDEQQRAATSRLVRITR